MPYLPKPDAAVKDIFAVTPEWLEERGLRAVLLDVDNTLAGYIHHKLSREALGHLRGLMARGVAVSIVSNAAEKRVRRFADEDIPYIARAGKPDPAALLKMAKQLKVEPGEAAMVGDQLLTDIAAGTRAGMYTVWVEPMRNNWVFDLFFRLRRRVEKSIAYSRKE